MGSITTNVMGEVLRDLRGTFRPLLLYNGFFAVINFLLLTPLFAWAVSFAATSSRGLSISNGEIFSFLLSLRGVLFLLLAGTLTAVTLYIKHAGMMVIAWASMTGQPVSAVGALGAVIRRLPGLTLLGCYHVAAHAILLAPLVVLGMLVYESAFASMRVYLLFQANPLARWIGLTAVVLLSAAALATHGAVYLHWVFSLPALLVDGLSAGSALAYTHGLLKGTRRRIGAVVFLLWSAMVLLPFILGHGFHAMGGAIFTRLPEGHRLVLPAVLAMMAGYVAASFCGEFLSVAAVSMTITRLYAVLRQTRDAGQAKTAIPAAETGQEESVPRQETAPASRAGGSEPASRPPSQPSLKEVIAFLMIAAVMSLAAAGGILGNFDLHDNVRITAHRGSSWSNPENTLAAIRHAVEEGADYVEVDVRLTADGHPVLLHDADLFRVAGERKSPSDLTYEQIKGLDVGSWFAPRFQDERIPLLSDVLAFCKGKIRVNIELKADANPRRLAERVVQTLHEHGDPRECIISSASIRVLEHVSELDPDIPIGFIISQSIGDVTTLAVDFLSISSRQATPGLIDAARIAGKEVHVWTVNRPRQMTQFIDLGVDNIITDMPAVARDILAERAAMSNEALLLIKVRNWFLR